MKIVWDMETGDPDDFFTLLLLAGHPSVELVAVTIMPGTAAQVGVVRWALAQLGREDIFVGASRLDYEKDCVSEWHYNAFGRIEPSREAEDAAALLVRVCDDDTTLVTGAALKNLGAALRLGGLRIGRWVAQGGFAGEGVVPADKQLAKFAGKTTCPTYNLNGDVKSSLAALVAPEINARRFVSKNVCHGVVYDHEMHERVTAVKDKRPSLGLIWRGMEHYLDGRPSGKAFHDPLAACCAIDESIGTWAEVELYRRSGEWGSRLAPGSGTYIITDYDHERFLAVLLA